MIKLHYHFAYCEYSATDMNNKENKIVYYVNARIRNAHYSPVSYTNVSIILLEQWQPCEKL